MGSVAKSTRNTKCRDRRRQDGDLVKGERQVLKVSESYVFPVVAQSATVLTALFPA